MEAVGKRAARIVTEVRRQFREHPEILAGRRKPDHAHAVSLPTRAFIRDRLIPGALPALVPLAGALHRTPLGPPGSGALMMGGVLIGAVASGLILALFLSTGGAAWDNAKKYIESGHFGGKGPPTRPRSADTGHVKCAVIHVTDR